MKIVFAGPSLRHSKVDAGLGIHIKPPACQGDVLRAVQQGATAIGLIDGQFEFVAPVWHKEILYALSQGIPVFGAASMGALRAAECAPFGMVGIGSIFEDYVTGRRVDDGDVALLHGPAELGYQPVTVPLVNVDATLARAEKLGFLLKRDCDEIAAAARSIFFKDRTWIRIAEAANFDQSNLGSIAKKAWTDQKLLDALELLKALQVPAPHSAPSNTWIFNRISSWRELFAQDESELQP